MTEQAAAASKSFDEQAEGMAVLVGGFKVRTKALAVQWHDVPYASNVLFPWVYHMRNVIHIK